MAVPQACPVRYQYKDLPLSFILRIYISHSQKSSLPLLPAPRFTQTGTPGSSRRWLLCLYVDPKKDKKGPLDGQVVIYPNLWGIRKAPPPISRVVPVGLSVSSRTAKSVVILRALHLDVQV